MSDADARRATLYPYELLPLLEELCAQRFDGELHLETVDDGGGPQERMVLELLRGRVRAATADSAAMGFGRHLVDSGVFTDDKVAGYADMCRSAGVALPELLLRRKKIGERGLAYVESDHAARVLAHAFQSTSEAVLEPHAARSRRAQRRLERRPPIDEIDAFVRSVAHTPRHGAMLDALRPYWERPLRRAPNFFRLIRRFRASFGTTSATQLTANAITIHQLSERLDGVEDVVAQAFAMHMTGMTCFKGERPVALRLLRPVARPGSAKAGRDRRAAEREELARARKRPDAESPTAASGDAGSGDGPAPGLSTPASARGAAGDKGEQTTVGLGVSPRVDRTTGQTPRPMEDLSVVLAAGDDALLKTGAYKPKPGKLATQDRSPLEAAMAAAPEDRIVLPGLRPGPGAVDGEPAMSPAEAGVVDPGLAGHAAGGAPVEQPEARAAHGAGEPRRRPQITAEFAQAVGGRSAEPGDADHGPEPPPAQPTESEEDDLSTLLEAAPMGGHLGVIAERVLRAAEDAADQDVYSFFGLSPDASFSRVRATYRRLAWRWRHEAYEGYALPPMATDALGRLQGFIQRGYEVLTDLEQRLEHDRAFGVEGLARDEWLPRFRAEGVFKAAQIKMTEGDHEAASDLLRQASDLSPDEPEYLSYLAWAIYCSGVLQRDDALDVEDPDELLHEALDMDRDLESAWIFLARVHDVMGNHAHSLGAYREVLRVNPTSVEADEAVTRLGPSATAVTKRSGRARSLAARLSRLVGG